MRGKGKRSSEGNLLIAVEGEARKDTVGFGANRCGARTAQQEANLTHEGVRMEGTCNKNGKKKEKETGTSDEE
jgi:hypothetical protein